MTVAVHGDVYARTLRPLLPGIHHRHLHVPEHQVREPAEAVAQRVPTGVAEVQQREQLPDKAVEPLCVYGWCSSVSV